MGYEAKFSGAGCGVSCARWERIAARQRSSLRSETTIGDSLRRHLPFGEMADWGLGVGRTGKPLVMGLVGNSCNSSLQGVGLQVWVLPSLRDLIYMRLGPSDESLGHYRSSLAGLGRGGESGNALVERGAA